MPEYTEYGSSEVQKLGGNNFKKNNTLSARS